MVLSDHGEAVGLPGDSPWSMTGPPDDPYAWPVITGHGTSVLSPHQYRVLLAVRGFGAPRGGLAGAARDRRPERPWKTSTPTLNEWLGLGMAPTFDGHSLLPLLRATPPGRPQPLGEPDPLHRDGIQPARVHARRGADGQRGRQTQCGSTRSTGQRGGCTSGAANAASADQRQYAAMRGSEIVAAIPGNYSARLPLHLYRPGPQGLAARAGGPPGPARLPRRRRAVGRAARGLQGAVCTASRRQRAGASGTGRLTQRVTFDATDASRRQAADACRHGIQRNSYKSIT